MRPGRLIVPFILSVVFFGAFKFAVDHPKDFPASILGVTVNGSSITKWLEFLAFVALIFFVVRLIDFLFFDWTMSRRRNVSAPLILREIVSIGLYFTLIGVAMTQIMDWAVGGWLATGTVLAAILGLALQETLGNLFAGIALHLEDSFEIGDVVRSGDFIGVVEGARWRGTRLRTFNNTIVILPNSMLARERLEVFPRQNLNGRVLSVGIDYNVPPATVINVLTLAMRHVEGISHSLPPLARVAGFAESGVVYELKYFTSEYARRDVIDADVRKAVWYALKRNNVSIPFPVRAYQAYKPPQREDHDLSPTEVVGVLHEADILSPLSPDAFETLAGAARVHFYSKGESIISRGSAGDSMFIVNDGTVSVRMSENGAPWREVAQLGPGSVFGEMALLTGEARTADVVALTDVTAVEIAKDALAPVLQDHPELAMAMSAKVMERRERQMVAETPGDDEGGIVGRIRAWFGL